MEYRELNLSRRAFAGAALAAGTLGAAGLKAADSHVALTPSSDMGPFYPIQRIAEEDADLTWIKGHSQRALGNVIEVSGRVLDRRGNPVSGAMIELWQCNSVGRYAHAADVATAPLDPNFQGFAAIRTGKAGDWHITTIKPSGYDSPIGKRTPHIHFDVRGMSHRLIAQMYFEDDHATNSTDELYKTLGKDAFHSVAKLAAPTKYNWDIVLMDG